MRALILLCLLLLPGLAQADEPKITVTVGDKTRSFTRDELLARPDATTIEVPFDITYRVPMTYRAVPVASLLEGMTLSPNSVIEAVALDGFIAQLPLDLVLNRVKAGRSLSLRSSRRTIPGRQSRRRARAPGRSTSCGPGLRSAASGASNGRFRWRSW